MLKAMSMEATSASNNLLIPAQKTKAMKFQIC
jgi:hypothetical protein